MGRSAQVIDGGFNRPYRVVNVQVLAFLSRGAPAHQVHRPQVRLDTGSDQALPRTVVSDVWPVDLGGDDEER